MMAASDDVIINMGKGKMSLPIFMMINFYINFNFYIVIQYKIKLFVCSVDNIS